MKILNIWGGPGSGKSTTAAGVFFEMKKLGLEVELVQEYAKDMVYEQRHNILTDQIYVFAKQQRRIARLADHALDWVITDSPIPLGLVYSPAELRNNAFESLVWQVFHKYENHNFLLTRRVPFSPVGRNQKTLAEAEILDELIQQLLMNSHTHHEQIPGGEPAVDVILTKIGVKPALTSQT